MNPKIPIAILAATGTVGQKMIALLADHPHFYVHEVAASPSRVGKVYSEVTHWREKSDMPDGVKKLILKDPIKLDSKYILSALPGDVSLEMEPALARQGKIVISNASGMRMRDDVPLVIPEVNSAHLDLLKQQKTPGKIITNPNCATVFLCMGLAPLMELGIVKHVSIVTLQALSGAGYPGVASLDAIGNVIPNIGGEEEKVESEAMKILGGIDKPADFLITSHVHRVPIVSGHFVAMHVFFESEVFIEKVNQKLEEWKERFPLAYKIHYDQFRPQPALDLEDFDQRTHIGRVKQGGDTKTVGLVAFGHNLVRGAAGAALLNLEKAYELFGD